MDHGPAHNGYGSSTGESFRRYYLRHVAISEGCGCAELSITPRTDGGGAGLASLAAALRRLAAAFRWLRS